jgi:phosphoribosylformylglycinamidine cyclo-ligase
MSAHEPRKDGGLTYDTVGVASSHEEENLAGLGKWIAATFDLNPARPLLPLGYFANVLPLTKDLALAISTDGVGTKILIAQQLGRYDTVGIDCVAMNANDILCVGATPISMVDYIAVEEAEPQFLAELAKGLYEGARQAAISIPGGEVAQIREMIRGDDSGRAFDLVGTCVGTVHPDRILVGKDVAPGDVVIGLESSGVHSNGFTLARRVLFEQAGLAPTDHVPELGGTLGEVLLTPTFIYVREVVQMLDERLAMKALVHVTGDGFFNLLRVENQQVGFVLDSLPEPLPIFRLIQQRGGVSDAEMYRVYNMGVGFCIVVAPRDAERVIAIAEQHGRRATPIGHAVADPRRRLWLPGPRLVGESGAFAPLSEPPPRA